MIIGSHVSFKKQEQLLGSVKEALSYGSNTFMFYTGTPQNTRRLPIDIELTAKAIELMKDNDIDINNVVVHAPYIVNIANNEKEDSYQFSISFLKQEISRIEMMGVNKIILHPGSYVNVGLEKGIENVVNALDIVLDNEKDIYICLETMSGKGSEIGRTIDEIKAIFDRVKFPNKLMICLDTCHLHDSGYDISNFDNILDEIEEKIGKNKIACIHINDSKKEMGAQKDRHENIGFGKIGFNNILNVIYNKRLESVPKILETPYVSKDDASKERLYPPYKFEMKMFKNKEFNSNLITDIRDYYKK